MTSIENKHEGGRATPEQMARKHVYVVNGSPDWKTCRIWRWS